MLLGGVSAFVTCGALFGIKLVGRHGEHVVALDADAVKDGTDNRAWLARIFQAGWLSSRGSLGARISGHEVILACEGRKPTEGGQHPLGISSASSICVYLGSAEILERLSHEQRGRSGWLLQAQDIEKAARLLLE